MRLSALLGVSGALHETMQNCQKALTSPPGTQRTRRVVFAGLYTALCPCIAICDVAEWAGDNKFLACCCGAIVRLPLSYFRVDMHTTLPCLQPCVGGLIRKDFREVTNIEGGYLGDCLCHCGPLHFFSLCQELNELKLRTGDIESKNYGIKRGMQYDVEAIKASIAQAGGAQQQAQAVAVPQQGGYAPQQGGYPPQQGGYPPQQGGYPPQQGAHAPFQQQSTYPAQY